MNDYALINSLLKDESEQSKLKLKMIIVFVWFNMGMINSKYRFKLVELFEERFEKIFEKQPYLIEYFEKQERELIKKMFSDVNFTRYDNVQTANFIT